MIRFVLFMSLIWVVGFLVFFAFRREPNLRSLCRLAIFAALVAMVGQVVALIFLIYVAK